MKSKINIRLAFMLLWGLLATGASAQSVKSLVREGNKLYSRQKYSDAEVQYRKALAKNPRYGKSIFNLGDALYQQKNFKGAEKFFGNLAVKKSSASPYVAQSWYNLGNTYLSQKQYEKSIAAYIRALRQDPTDMNAKYNLTYARKMLKKQQQQKKKQKQNKKNQNKKNQNKKNQNKKNQNNKNQNKKNQNNQQKQNNQQNKSGRKKQQISPQEAQRILNALKNNEKNTLKKLEKQKAKAVKAKANVINW
jgi:Ca-activated chloride channel family protein